jgi:hypothetical protein
MRSAQAHLFSPVYDKIDTHPKCKITASLGISMERASTIANPNDLNNLYFRRAML